MAQILVIEDEVDIQDLVRMALELAGHEVRVAANGADGLLAVVADPPDLVILDVVLPGIDGWQVLTELKRAPVPAIAEIPVVMLTAKVDDMDRIRGGIEGAIRYVTKPFTIAELRGEVEEALAGEPEPERRRRARKEALGRLARLEGAWSAGGARPQGATRAAPPPPARRIGAADVAALSARQRDVLVAVARSETVGAAAERLGVSRTSVYSNLRRTARRLGVATVPELLALVRAGAVDLNDPG